MSDDIVSTPDLQAEFDRSRESAAQLLQAFAQKIGGLPAVRSAADGVHRAAHYVQEMPLKDVAARIDKAVRRKPVYSIAIAVVAGFLIGRALRPR